MNEKGIPIPGKLNIYGKEVKSQENRHLRGEFD